MVFFSCDGCGEMLKKNKVDAHAARCRRCASVSCVDCSVSFWGDDYRLHTSCITEAERYEKPGLTNTGKKKTKRNPHQEWMDVVETCAAAAPVHLKDYFATMTQLDNIPRKPKPFANFASNSLQLRGRDKSIVDEIWGHLQRERERRLAAKEAEKKEVDAKKEREKEEQQRQEKEEAAAAAVASDTDTETNTKTTVIDAKKVKKIAKKTLKKAPKRTMEVKALRKILEKEMGLPKSAKKQLKSILLKTAKASKDRITIDGKLMILIK